MLPYSHSHSQTHTHTSPRPPEQTILKSPWVATSLIAAFAVFTLTACGRDDSRTAGQQIDSTIAKVEKKAGEMKAEAKVNAEQAVARTEAATAKAGEAIGQTADKALNKLETGTAAVADKVADASITTLVNAELAKDPALSALRINVDTNNGKVMLRGSAPSNLARDRATALAAKIKGVSAVDNQLEVRS